MGRGRVALKGILSKAKLFDMTKGVQAKLRICIAQHRRQYVSIDGNKCGNF